MRNKETPDPVFRQYANRLHRYAPSLLLSLSLYSLLTFSISNSNIIPTLHRILVEEALTYLPSESVDIQTPCGPYTGKQISTDKILAVSIIRAGICCFLQIYKSPGDSLLQSVLDLIPNVKIGKILIQRDEKSEDKRPIVRFWCIFYL